MNRYLGIINYFEDISQSDYIEKTYENLKNKFNISQKLDLFKTNHINLSNGFFNKSFGKDKYVIMYIGNIINVKEIKKDLTSKGYKFSSKTQIKKDKVIPTKDVENYLEAEILLTCYHEYKEKFLEHLNGTFSICIYDKTNNIIFLSRDRIGIKPIYYTKNKADGSFIFSTNIKDILNVPNMKATLDKQGALELIGIGPIHSPGFIYFKDIYELMPGHYAIYSHIGLITHKYWDLEAKGCDDSEMAVANKLYTLLSKSIKSQVNDTEENIGVIISDIINSGIVLSVAKNNSNNVHTLTYNKSPEYIELLKKYFNISNYNVISDSKVLYSLLIPAMMARDMPGMAFLDSENLELYNAIKNNNFNKCISSSCTNEIFEIKDKANISFPYTFSENIRGNLINKNIASSKVLQEYIEDKYKDITKDILLLDDDTIDDIIYRKNTYITIKWYIHAFIQKINHLASNIDLEIVLPYLDYKIIEYIYNIKCTKQHSKYLLYNLFNKLYPNISPNSSNICESYDPQYISILEHELKKILNDSSSKLLQIIDKDYVIQILKQKGTNLISSHNDELITYPQLLAYLIQIEYWLNIYEIEISID